MEAPNYNVPKNFKEPSVRGARSPNKDGSQINYRSASQMEMAFLKMVRDMCGIFIQTYVSKHIIQNRE